MNNPIIPIKIPRKLHDTINTSSEGRQWLDKIEDRVMRLAVQWELQVAAPIENNVTCSWVAPCTRRDGSSAILKLGFPHMEALSEADGLRFWDGYPTVLLLEFDREDNAMLLEQCCPGYSLKSEPEERQDRVIADLLKKLWRRPDSSFQFRPLAEMVYFWIEAAINSNQDRKFLDKGISVFKELLADQTEQVLLATDLHSGNVLKAGREPWLVIDPKPFIGDPCYDATQHLLNCMARLESDPDRTITNFSKLLSVDQERVRRWLFARLAVEWNSVSASTQYLASRLAE